MSGELVDAEVEAMDVSALRTVVVVMVMVMVMVMVEDDVCGTSVWYFLIKLLTHEATHLLIC